MSEEETVAKLKQLEKMAIICQHLNMDIPLEEKLRLGFNFPCDLDLDTEAWCDKCEAILQREGEWTEYASNFANFKGICLCCFLRLKEEFKN